MTWDEFQKIAVTSAERYYDFLEREGKGKVVDYANDLIDTGRYSPAAPVKKEA